MVVEDIGEILAAHIEAPVVARMAEAVAHIEPAVEAHTEAVEVEGHTELVGIAERIGEQRPDIEQPDTDRERHKPESGSKVRRSQQDIVREASQEDSGEQPSASHRPFGAR
jgi:hypothetical protein